MARAVAPDRSAARASTGYQSSRDRLRSYVRPRPRRPRGLAPCV